MLLPTAPIQYGSEENLDELIDQYLRRYLDAPDFDLKLMRAYVKMTWVYDTFNSIPYMRFRGGYDSGKSRRMEAVGRICYRGIPALRQEATEVDRDGPCIVGVDVRSLGGFSIRFGYRQTRDGDRLAPQRLPFVLDREDSARKNRQARGFARSPGVDPYHESS